MANKVLSRPQVSRSLPRNAFDRSFVVNYTQNAGELHVVLCKPCIAGTKGKINRQVFTRTNEVNTAAFATMQMHYQFYKVPIRLLWSYWPDFKLQINDINSSSLQSFGTGSSPINDTSLPVQVPSFDISQCFREVQNILPEGEDVPAVGGSARLLNVGNANRFLQLLEELGYSYGASFDESAPPASIESQLVSLLPLAAYHKVYYDHFRNTAYETNNPYAYNLDWFGKTKTILNPDPDGTDNERDQFVWQYLSQMHFVNYRNDYFKNIYPHLNYVASAPSAGNWSFPPLVGAIGLPSPVGDRLFTGGQVPNTGVSSRITTVQNIRAAFALDKLMRASAYAPKHVKEQFEARFGVKMSDSTSNESEYLGSFANDIVIGEVTSTANTNTGDAGDNLGAIGGKGIGSSRFESDIDFYCEEDSFIIGVSYVLPRTSYDFRGVDGYNSKLLANEFFQPEFQDLGLEPLYLKELSMGSTQSRNDTILGYRPRNEVYKISYDKNLGAFKERFIESQSINDDGRRVLSYVNGWLSPFVIHSGNVLYESGEHGVQPRYFKCLPTDLDPIFVMAYDGTALRSQFFSNLIIKFVTNQDMSVHGQPRF